MVGHFLWTLLVAKTIYKVRIFRCIFIPAKQLRQEGELKPSRTLEPLEFEVRSFALGMAEPAIGPVPVTIAVCTALQVFPASQRIVAVVTPKTHLRT